MVIAQWKLRIIFYTDPYQEFSKSLDPRRSPDPDQNRKNYLWIHNTTLNKVFPINNTVPYQVSITQKYLAGMILCIVLGHGHRITFIEQPHIRLWTVQVHNTKSIAAVSKGGGGGGIR
jgi:hypothetical protein